MKLSDLPIPEIYLESSDFRFFLKWFESVITRLNYDTENILDLYDPQRCPEHLLWMLADTMGYKYDDRLDPAFCRLVLLYFMSMIRYKGSKSGVTLAAEVNLAQFNLQEYAKEKDKYGKDTDILKNRLEDTSIPVNSVYVTAHTAEGFIDIVYFSDTKPIDACIEYVRPLGMYCFQHAGVKYDGRTKISIDARLTNIYDAAAGEGITRVGHYSREDYARMQKMQNEKDQIIDTEHKRRSAWKRNQPREDLAPPRGDGGPTQDAGYRALYSLQLANGDHITKSLLRNGPIFDLSYQPQDIEVAEPNDRYRTDNDYDWQAWNLRYNNDNESAMTYDVITANFYRTSGDPPHTMYDNTQPTYSPVPAVNPIMATVGDAIALYQQSYQDFTSEIKQNEKFTVESSYSIEHLTKLLYGTTSNPEATWQELHEGTDFKIVDANSVSILSSSTIIPPSAEVGKTLRIYYTYCNNTEYRIYDNSVPGDDKFVKKTITPRDTRDN